jgi:hypothetical protein
MEQKRPRRYRIIALDGLTFGVEDSYGVGLPTMTTGFRSAHDAIRWIEKRQHQDILTQESGCFGKSPSRPRALSE